METSVMEETIEKPTRPFGVWFLTIYMGLFAGLFPLGASLFLMFSPEAQAATGIIASGLIMPIILAIVVIITAIGAWRGDNRFKFAFLIAVTIHYILMGYQNYQIAQLASSGVIDSSLAPRAWGRAFRGVFWIPFCWWYFTSQRASPFYESRNRMNDQ